MSTPRAKGTAAESAVVGHLRRHWPHAERRALHGGRDLGDVTGIPDLVWEVKAGARIDLASWADETRREQVNADAAVGLLVVRRRGAPVGRWFTVLTLDDAIGLLRGAGW